MSDAAMSLTVLDRIQSERHKQVALGYTVEHDDTHQLTEWARYIQRRLNGIVYKSSSIGWAQDASNQLVEIAALAVAALESAERREVL